VGQVVPPAHSEMNRRIHAIPLLCVSLLPAQAPPPREAITGTVLREDSGAAVSGAEIRLQLRSGGSTMTWTTNTEGRFSFSGRPPGAYILRVEMRNVTGVSTQFVFSTNPVRYTSVDGTTPDLVVRVSPTAAIAGRVLTQGGRPVAGAQVRVLRPGFTRTGRDLFLAASIRTNAAGEYRVETLPPGRYTVAARPVVMPPAVAPSTYYSSTIDATPERERNGIDIRIQHVTGVRLRGRIKGGFRDRGIAPLVFLIRHDPTDECGSAIVRPDGSFTLEGVPPGSYTLKGTPQLGSTNIEVRAADVADIEIAAAPLIEVSGRVQPKIAGLRLLLIPEDGNALLAQTGADGGFVFKDVAAGVYRVKPAIRQDLFIASARWNGQEVVDSGVDFTKARSSLEIAVNAQSGRIDGKANGLAQVVLVPDPPDRKRSSLYRLVSAEPSGAFSLTGIAPGKYKLFAWRHVDPDAYENPEFLGPYESRGRSITVTAGSVQKVLGPAF
jgi:hypothetical protein